MNSFLKGFTSLFDWMFPANTYQELSNDLDDRMQELYDRHNFGKYNNPLKYPYQSVENPCSVSYSHNLAGNISRAIEPQKEGET
jgi:hypothetical protein